MNTKQLQSRLFTRLFTVGVLSFPFALEGGELFRDNFSKGLQSHWTVVDEGPTNAPSEWKVFAGILYKTGNADRSSSHLLTGDPAWTDYSLSTRARTSSADGGVGLLFGYRDSRNYYRFLMDGRQSSRSLVKVVNGLSAVLAQDSVRHQQGKWYRLAAKLTGGRIEIRIDGKRVFGVADVSFNSGKIALYTLGNSEAGFDDVVVSTGAARMESTAGGISGEQELLNDDFSGLLANNWEAPVDEGAGQSAWQINAGVLEQTSGISGEGASPLAKPGTYLAAGKTDWTDYTATTKMQMPAAGAIGLIFGYSDTYNYYRFSINAQPPSLRLVKVVSGVFTSLASNEAGYPSGDWHSVQAKLSGGAVDILIDGTSVFQVNDASLQAGKVALYSWGNTAARFDDVSVTGVQDGCSYSVAPAAATVGAEVATGTVAVTAPAGCGWTAQTTEHWISITAGASGSGDGTVAYSVAANTSPASRQGAIAIGDQTFELTQEGACAYTISPENVTVAASGGSGQVVVTAAAPACAWKVISNTSWITIVSGGAASGNGTVGYSVQPSSTSLVRHGSVMIAGRTFAVTQEGRPCTYAITPAQMTIGNAARNDKVALTTPDGCPWSPQSQVSWLTLTSSQARTGSGNINFSVKANTTSTQRQGTITAGGQTFTMIQNPKSACEFSVSPASFTLAPIAATTSATVTSGVTCSWTSTSNSPWISIVSGQSGKGKMKVTFAIEANGTPVARQGSITIAGVNVAIAQGAGGMPNVYHVPASGNLQAALDQALPGDTITLEPGAVYRGSFYLRKKNGDEIITIRTADLNSLPAPGTRITPSYSSILPKIVSPDTSPAFRTDPGAHHYRLVGLEIHAPGKYSWDLIRLGSELATDISQQGSGFELDRLYIHGDPKLGAKRGITLNSASTVIKECYISDIKGIGQETQAINGWNGPGPYTITNNYLEAAGENIMFGGAIAKIPGIVPSNIVIKGNHLFKPLSWKQGEPSFAGKIWTVKNLLELKNARQVLIEGNVFENNWPQAQAGYAIVLTVRTETGAMPWAVVEDITFIRNIVRHSGAGVNILGRDGNGSYQGVTRRILFKDNIFQDIDWKRWGGDGRVFQLLQGPEDVTIDHNTVIGANVKIATMFAGQAAPRLIFTNNILQHGANGVWGTGTAIGTPTLDHYAPGSTFLGNLLVNAGKWPSAYPTGNYFPANLLEVGFTDVAGGNYRLLESSPYWLKGSDGTNPGADIDAVNLAVTGVVLP